MQNFVACTVIRGTFNGDKKRVQVLVSVIANSCAEARGVIHKDIINDRVDTPLDSNDSVEDIIITERGENYK